MRVKFTETVVHWKIVEIPEEGLKGAELENAAREIAFDAISLGDWDEEEVIENNFEPVPEKV